MVERRIAAFVVLDEHLRRCGDAILGTRARQRPGEFVSVRWIRDILKDRDQGLSISYHQRR
jgi:hypothetical protein